MLTSDLQKKIVLRTCEHNHPCDRVKTEVMKAVSSMKSKAKITLKKPAQIFAEEVQNQTNDIRCCLPTEETMKRTLRNQRSSDYPVVPTSFRDLEIEGIWTTTGNRANERLLLHDNGPHSTSRILIFATNNTLSYLTEDTWHIDGNFDLSPKFFCQLYVFRVRRHNVFVTAAFCVLQKKTRNTYEELLQILLEECTERDISLDPRTVHLDFELGAINALKNVFGNHIQIRGCFYHLAQSTFRKIQELGLRLNYLEDERFSLFCGMLDALAFLPLHDVPRGMNFLKSFAFNEEEKLMIDYFDSTYVTDTYKMLPHPTNNSFFLRRKPPMFPPEMWNVHIPTMQDEARTNNDTEGWNHRFKNLVGHSHPSIYELITKIREEVAVDDTKLQQIESGQSIIKRKRKKYEKLQSILKNLCSQYIAGQKSLEEFLKSVAKSIRFV